MTDSGWHAIVVGGGFFGATLATHLAGTVGGRRVLLVESGSSLLSRASYVNQARVHVGYHYPRSYLTALRSRINAPRFIERYRDCIHDAFTHYYAIGRVYSNVTAGQFRRFCERIGAPLSPAEAGARRLFNPSLIEDVFQVPEYTFDAARLRGMVESDLESAGVSVRLETTATRVERGEAGALLVTLRSREGEQRWAAGNVFNCTYSRLNHLHAASGLPIVPLKHELTEMALVEPPRELAGTGVTVMCGPFFSMLPFPPRGLSTLSHVRYTPHSEWHDRHGEPVRDGDRLLRGRPGSAFPAMVRDAARYIPAMRDSRQVDSLWEVKTVLPRSEVDDSRPILVGRDHGMPGFHCVIGSKMDNVFDMIQYVEDAVETAAPAI